MQRVIAVLSVFLLLSPAYAAEPAVDSGSRGAAHRLDQIGRAHV